MNLPIPSVTPENLVFYKKHMKLSDERTAVRLVGESNMAQLVWDQMMNIYKVKATAMGTDDKVLLNKAVQEARTAWLADQGVTVKGLIISIAGTPCWKIDQEKIGPRTLYYDDMVEKIKVAQTPQKLGSLKRVFKVLQKEFVEGKPDSSYRNFHLGQLNRVNTAVEVRAASI